MIGALMSTNVNIPNPPEEGQVSLFRAMSGLSITRNVRLSLKSGHTQPRY